MNQLKDKLLLLCLAGLVNGCVIQGNLPQGEVDLQERKIKSLIRQLNNKDFSTCQKAAKELAGFGVLAVPRLIKALNHDRKHVRFFAASILGNIGEPAEAAVPALVQTLEQKDFKIYQNPDLPLEFHWVVTMALGKIGGPAIPVLIQLLEDKKGKIRARSHTAFELNLRAHAAFALVEVDEPSDEIVDALIKALSDKDVQVRRSAASVFWRKPDKKAIPSLIKAIKDGDEQVRLYTVAALGMMEQAAQKAVPALAEGLTKKDFHTKYRVFDSFHIEVVKTLIAIGPSAISTLIEALHHGDERVCSLAAEGLGRRKALTALPALIEVLNDESELVRNSSAEALRKIGTPEALEAIEEYKSELPSAR